MVTYISFIIFFIISSLANKEGKALLYMYGAFAIQCSPEIKVFFEGKLSKDKHEMSKLSIA